MSLTLLGQRFVLCVPCVALLLFAPLPAGAKTGFLVVAQDRGFVGNRETRALVNDFAKSYPAALAFQGREASGFKKEYAAYLTKAIHTLKAMGVTQVVVIPLFVSSANPILQRTRQSLLELHADLPIQWAPAMATSHLIGQVLLDRVMELSQTPSHERLILLGLGAMDPTSETRIKRDIGQLAAYVTRYLRFQDVEILIYYDRAAPQADEHNQTIKAHLLDRISQRGQTLIVPAFIGPKYDHTMSVVHWLGRFFAERHASYLSKELLPHPNILRWLKKTAHTFTASTTPEDIGVIIMPHGAHQPYNDAVERLIDPLRTQYRIEMAYGMGDPSLLQEAVTRLEQAGATRIIVARLYALAEQFQAKIEYLLGLSTTLLTELAANEIPPPQVRSAALFATFGGYEEDPEMARILCERIQEISRNPVQETVLLLAHGAKSDKRNAKWLTVMNTNIARLRSLPRCRGYRVIRAFTVREDWPELRAPALDAVRAFIEQESRHGRVLVIANRLYGAGPYRTLLDGLSYTLNDKGFLHPILLDWLRNGIAQSIRTLTPHGRDEHR